MSKPRLLDLFCGAGGAAKGYQRAGFYVVGVDIKAQPRYCGDEFIQADAMTYPLEGFDAIHASPPCQQYSRAFKHMARDEPLLIDALRDEFRSLVGVPWVIENVPGAPIGLADDLFGHKCFQLCGTSFGLKVQRHRRFESNIPIVAPDCHHRQYAMNPHNADGRRRMNAEYGQRNLEKVWAQEMAVEWMSQAEAREAIPPAYTEWVGKELMRVLGYREETQA